MDIRITKNTTNTHHPHTSNKPFTHVGGNPMYCEILKESFGWDCYEVVISEGDVVVGGGRSVKVAGRLVSMPHMSVGDWWCEEDGVETFGLLGKYVDESLGIKNIEVRSLSVVSEYYDDRKVLSVMEINKNCFNGSNSIEKQLSSNLRRKIHKSGKLGVVVERAGINELNLNLFLKIYHNKIHELGSFPVPERYLMNLVGMWRNGEATLFFVYVGRKRVGAAINLSYNGFFENILFATDPRYYRYYITDALHYGMISYAEDIGMKHYSFGRSTVNGGVYLYKNHWPIKDYVVYRNFYKPLNSDIRYSGRLKKVCGVLPAGVREGLAGIVAKYVY